MYDGQESVLLRTIQSGTPETDKRFVDVLSETTLTIPPGLRQGERIDVTFDMKEDGRIDCSFLHEPSGTNETVSLTPQYDVDESKKSAIDAFWVE